MNIATDLSSSDINMYYAGCLCTYKNKPYIFSGIHETDEGYDEDDEVRLEHPNSDKYITRGNIYRLDFRVPLLGYFEVDNSVIFLSTSRQQTYKKGLCSTNISYFYPQEQEYMRLRRDLPRLHITSIAERNLTSYENIDAALEIKDAIAIHPNYAIVKKASYAKPVLYYRTRIIGYWDNGFHTFKDNRVHIHKLKLELGL